jgi:hypothetical protein
MWANSQRLPRQTLEAWYEAGKASYPSMYAAYPIEHEARPRQDNFKLFQQQLEPQRVRIKRRFAAWNDQSRCDP